MINQFVIRIFLKDIFYLIKKVSKFISHEINHRYSNIKQKKEIIFNLDQKAVEQHH